MNNLKKWFIGGLVAVWDLPSEIEAERVGERIIEKLRDPSCTQAESDEMFHDFYSGMPLGEFGEKYGLGIRDDEIEDGYFGCHHGSCNCEA